MGPLVPLSLWEHCAAPWSPFLVWGCEDPSPAPACCLVQVHRAPLGLGGAGTMLLAVQHLDTLGVRGHLPPTPQSGCRPPRLEASFQEEAPAASGSPGLPAPRPCMQMGKLLWTQRGEGYRAGHFLIPEGSDLLNAVQVCACTSPTPDCCAGGRQGTSHKEVSSGASIRGRTTSPGPSGWGLLGPPLVLPAPP